MAKEWLRGVKLSYLLGEIIAVFFIFFLGMVASISANNFSQKNKISLPNYSLNQLMIMFLVGTLLMLPIVFLPVFEKKRNKIYRIFFSFSTTYGAFIAFLLFFSIFGERLYFNIAAIIFSGSLLFWWKKKSSLISHNLLVGCGLAGMGAVLGLSVSPLATIAAIVIISFYDFIAVYKTKHMIKMAQSMMNSGAVMGLIIPPSIKEVSFSTKEIKFGDKFFIIGGGDIVLPLMMTTSLIPFGIEKAILMSFFSFAGIILSFFIYSSQKEKKPMPALPPIALCCIAGYIFINFAPNF